MASGQPHGLSRSTSIDAKLPTEYRGALSQLHLALVAGRRVALDLLAGADGARCEHRGALSQLHLALVAGRRVALDLLAGADGARCKHRGALSQLHLALVKGSGRPAAAVH